VTPIHGLSAPCCRAIGVAPIVCHGVSALVKDFTSALDLQGSRSTRVIALTHSPQRSPARGVTAHPPNVCLVRHDERSTSARPSESGYPGSSGPCEKCPRDRSLVREQPWANVCPGASPYRLDGPRAAVNGPGSSPIWVMTAVRLRRAASLTRRRVAPPPLPGTGSAPPFPAAPAPRASRGGRQRRRPAAHSGERPILAL
jgi:hypothetical protein